MAHQRISKLEGPQQSPRLTSPQPAKLNDLPRVTKAAQQNSSDLLKQICHNILEQIQMCYKFQNTDKILSKIPVDKISSLLCLA